MKKTRQVNLRISEQDYKILSLRAEQAKMSLSGYIRERAIFAARAQLTIDSLKNQVEYYKNMALSRTKWLEDEE